MNRPQPFRMLKRFMPRGLFGRSLLIIIAPVVILQGVVTYVFFERHYDIMTARMARGVAADIAFLVNITEYKRPLDEREKLLADAARALSYQVDLMEGEKLAGNPRHSPVDLKDAMTRVFAGQLGDTRRFASRFIGDDYVDVKIEVRDGILRVMIPRKRLVASNADIFILWMVGSSLVLLAVAILFLRNQVRPIERLAVAAENFGKGRTVRDFKPYGATEVRQAAQAFLTMRERIERHVTQRTEMLAGVSHDLKTPLTRLKLQFAMMDDTPETRAMRDDVIEMERMLDEYLDFARGEGGEESQSTDIGELVGEAATAAARAPHAKPDHLSVNAPPGRLLWVRRNALRRCITNLIDNAMKHGTHVDVAMHAAARWIEITIDDDGPGIPAARREEAFRPFHRLDEGRNLQKGGVGLGLAIARDIARAHGGELSLGDSPLGGLRATVRIPV